MNNLSQKNYEQNQQITLPNGLLNGQALGAVAAMKYGRSKISYSGCECIAVYNALLLEGKKVPFADVIKYLERYRVLFGFWGTNFLALGQCLGHFGMPVKRMRSAGQIAAALQKDHPALLTYWTKRRFASSIHTVCVRLYSAQTVEIYNAYNQCAYAIRKPISEFLQKPLICAYLYSDHQ